MSRAKRIVRYFFQALLVLILSAPVVLLLMAVQSSPSVPAAQGLSNEEILEVEQLLVGNAPGNVSAPTLQNLSLSEAELNLLVRYAIELLNLQSNVGVVIGLTGDTLTSNISIPVITRVLPTYLNLSAEFIGGGDLLRLNALQLGTLRIPGRLLESVMQELQSRYLADNRNWMDILRLLNTVKTLSLHEHQLALSLQWEPDLIARIRSQAQQFLISEQDRQRILRHYLSLYEIIDVIPQTTRAISLSTLVAPLFAAAEIHSATDSDPVAENRTLLLALAAYVNNEDYAQFLGTELVQDLPQLRMIEVRVQRRQDLAQHIASSAAITAAAGAGVAEKLSSTKEVYDARYRSGFSFSDLTANMAGVALGLTTTQSHASARTMQNRLAQLNSEEQFLPPVSTLNDGLSESDFNSLYRDNNAEYQKRLVEIESLVLELPLFSDL